MEILLFIFPLLVFFIIQFFSHIKNLNILYCLIILLMCSSFAISIYLFFKVLNLEGDIPLYLYPIINSNYFLIEWSLRLDLFVSLLTVIITLVASLFTIYSINFNKKNRINLHIIKNSSLAVFGTLILILSNNLIQLFAGWQTIILSSYLLVNVEKNKIDLFDNRKVFIFNRISDLGFFLSLFFLYSQTNSIDFDVIFESINLRDDESFILYGIQFSIFEGVLFILFLSFLLRCQQFYIPGTFYYFLKINTSSLALFYAAVFLPSGIYFILRFLALVQSFYNFSSLITLMGFIFTIIFTYLLFTSRNLKNFLVYIASSQFSIIIFTIGLKAYNCALFFLLTSTLSVTMLFLSFGIIISKLNDEQNIDNMGALIFKIPATFLFILIGSLSFVGVPFFSGFYSKELIFSSPLFFNESFQFLSVIIYFCFVFLMPYVLFKTILIVFYCQNNCNIHLYNKINERLYLTKTTLVLLALCLIYFGWFLNNLFFGLNSEILWNLALNGNSNLSLRSEYSENEWFLNRINLFNFVGIFLSIFNYVIIPKIGNNFKIKHNKFFKIYLSFLFPNN